MTPDGVLVQFSLVLPPFVADNPNRPRRFEQEARAAAALNQPNILAVFRWGRTKMRRI